MATMPRRVWGSVLGGLATAAGAANPTVTVPAGQQVSGETLVNQVQKLEGGASSLDMVIGAGASQHLNSNASPLVATALRTRIDAGGTQYVLIRSVARQTRIEVGGFQYAQGGEVIDATVLGRLAGIGGSLLSGIEVLDGGLVSISDASLTGVRAASGSLVTLDGGGMIGMSRLAGAVIEGE